MSEQDVKVTIGAEDSGAAAAFKSLEASAKASMAEVQKTFAGVTDAIGKIGKAFAGLTALLAGGKAFGAAIEAAVDWTEGAKRLSKALGVTTEVASGYQAALKHLGIDNDTLISATEKLSKQIYTNHDAFVRLGVATKDQQGNYRSIAAIMADVNTKLALITNMTERNIAGQQVYGKGWGELKAVVKLTGEEMAAAAKRAQELGLVVGPDATEEVEAYRHAMNDLKLAGTSVSITMGRELLPALTQIATAFANEGPAAGEVFGETLKVLAYGAERLAILFEKSGKRIGATLAMITSVFRGDKAMAQAIAKDLDGELARLDAKADGLWAKLNRPIPTNTSKAPDTGGPNPFTGQEHDTSRMSEFETQLQELKAKYGEEERLQGSFAQASLADERKYWQERLAITGLSSADQNAIKRKIADASLAIDKAGFEAELATNRAQQEAVKGNYDKQLELANDYAAKVAEKYSTESKEYAAASQRIVEIEREKLQQIDRLRTAATQTTQALALGDIDGQEQAANLALELGQITNAQLLEQERTFEDARNQVRREAMLEQLAIAAQDPNKNVEQIAALNAQKEQLEQEHQNRIAQIQGKAAIEASQQWRQVFQTMNAGFTGVLSAFLRGTQTIGATFKGLFVSVLDTITDTLAQMAARWLTTLITQQVTSRLFHSSQNLIDAKDAAAGAYKSTAGIPFVGPELAPAAAAAAFAGVTAFAKDGYDVPAGINPVTQLHEKEMVLPASIADTIRGLDAGNGGGAQRPVNLNFNIKANDGASVKKMLLDNKSTIAQALKQHMRSKGDLVPTY